MTPHARSLEFVVIGTGYDNTQDVSQHFAVVLGTNEHMLSGVGIYRLIWTNLAALTWNSHTLFSANRLWSCQNAPALTSHWSYMVINILVFMYANHVYAKKCESSALHRPS